MKHHVPIDAPGRARPVASTTTMYTLASVRLLSFWLTATCSSAVKAYTYAYRTCVKRSRVYTVIHSCGRGNGARATRRLPNVYGHVMFHPRPSPFSMFPSPAQLNARNKSRNGEGLGPRLSILRNSVGVKVWYICCSKDKKKSGVYAAVKTKKDVGMGLRMFNACHHPCHTYTLFQWSLAWPFLHLHARLDALVLDLINGEYLMVHHEDIVQSHSCIAISSNTTQHNKSHSDDSG